MIDEEIIHHNLKAIEAASLGSLYLIAKSLKEVLVHDTIRRGEESKDMADEVTLIIVEFILPVVHVLGEVHLLCGPEGSLGLLVHLPNLATMVGD